MRSTDDPATSDAVAERLGEVIEVVVSAPGHLAALEAGAAAATGDIIAFTDDDAVPRREWLRRALTHFADPRVGGVGGRDLVATGDHDPTAFVVGRIGRWGKVIGNHHVGIGPARPVDISLVPVRTGARTGSHA